MAVPKRKTSKRTKRQRRTHKKLAFPVITKCYNCGANIKPHIVCRECGFYRKKEIIKIN